MSSIKIISPPAGLAPEDVRKQWVGLVIPLVGENTSEYQVETLAALNLLHEKDKAAAVWFLRNTHFTNDGRLDFAKEVCEVIE